MMKKVACILFSLLMVMSCFTACSGSGKVETTTAQTTAPEEVEVDPRDETYESITIADVPLSEYTIVYAPDAFENAKKQYRNSFTYGETHFAKLIAEELAIILENMTGVKLNVVADTEAETANEILIGKTSRSQSDGSLMRNKHYVYKLSVSGTKLCIEGGSSAANYYAMEQLFAYLAGQNSENVTVPAGYLKRGDADVTTVACIGDSITEGYGCTNGTHCSYPSILQRILWKDCVVINYGVSGKTMREDLADAYITTNAYTTLMENADKVDIALIMPGTNDSNRDRNWNSNSDALFEEGYRNLLNNLNAKQPEITYFMMNCPVYDVTKNENYGSETVRNLQKKLTDDLIKEGWDLHFFDMYTYTKDTVTLRNFGDGLHPNDKGYGMLANGVGNMLKEYFASEEAAG